MTLKRIKIRKIWRKIRGFIRECDNCGAKRQELFRLYTFPKPDVEQVKFYCRQCYVKMIKRPRHEF